jgi:glutamine cyclotransferase
MLLCASILLIANTIPKAEAQTPSLNYKVLLDLPHRPYKFTQGLDSDGEHLIESSGLYGKSFVHRYHKLSGDVLHRFSLPRRQFAEGLVRLGDSVFLLTWKAGLAYRLSAHDLRPQGSYRFRGEGWGLAKWKHLLVMSDGSSQLQLRSSQNFQLQEKITVFEDGREVHQLNDLTVGLDVIWANVWHQTYILAIAPESGRVIARLELDELAQRQLSNNPEHVLNGLAWDPEQNALWVTGKGWNRRYLLQLDPLPVSQRRQTN